MPSNSRSKGMNITNQQVTEYLNGFYCCLDEDLEILRETGERDNVPIILRETEAVLSLLLSLKRPKRILEIGTAIGYSAVYFAKKCPEAVIYTIDKDETAVRSAKHNIDQAGLSDRIHILLGDGQEQEEKLSDNRIGDFDFVFIDGAKSHYRRFLDSALPLCRKGALIVSDNILMRAATVSEEYDTGRKHKTNRKKMREYVEYICSSRELETSLMSVGDGLAVSIYRGENEERRF